MSFYKKKKDKEKVQSAESGVCLSDNATAKSSEDPQTSGMKIRIDFNVLTTGKVKI